MFEFLGARAAMTSKQMRAGLLAGELEGRAWKFGMSCNASMNLDQRPKNSSDGSRKTVPVWMTDLRNDCRKRLIICHSDMWTMGQTYKQDPVSFKAD
jgi:hypothetical protein